MVKKLIKRQKKSEEIKKKIVKCAMHLFAKYGYDNVSIDDIAKLANSSKGSFYHYFNSKDELFLYYRQALNAQYLEFYEQLMYDPSYKIYNGLEKLFLMCMFILNCMTSNGDEFARIADIRLFRDWVDIREEITYKDNFDSIFPALINQGKTDGSIRKDMSADEIIDNLRLFFDGMMYDWEVSRGKYNILEKYSYVLEFFCYSIAG